MTASTGGRAPARKKGVRKFMQTAPTERGKETRLIETGHVSQINEKGRAPPLSDEQKQLPHEIKIRSTSGACLWGDDQRMGGIASAPLTARAQVQMVC